ncbi:MAG: hypothetical protein ABSF82_02570 [Candidatus Bathyarchaeia archaeon]|jgi:hypothetical protein
MPDFAEEIKRIWQIDQAEFSLTFVEATEIPHTIPRPVDGQVHIEVRGDPSLDMVILFHEGAHVFLFHLGYPPSKTRINGAVPELTGNPVDFLAEYYALRLELEKRFHSKTDRLEELRGRWNDSIAPVPIRGDHQLRPGDGQLAIHAAVCAHLLTEWGALAEAKQTDMIMKASFSDLAAIYSQVLSVLQQAPPLPQQSQKFSSYEVSKIKSVLASSINSIYRGSCMLEFM